MNEPDPPLSLAAERMRRYRERRREGLRCLMIELRETEIDALIRDGLLKPETRNDPGAQIAGAQRRTLKSATSFSASRDVTCNAHQLLDLEVWKGDTANGRGCGSNNHSRGPLTCR